MRWTLPLLAVLLAGCADNPPVKTPLHVDLGPAECEELGVAGCLLPWPSSRYLVADPATATGYRVSIPEAAMPETVKGVRVDPAPFNAWDGFSAMSTLVTVLPAPVDASALVPWTSPSASLADDSPTVLVDVTTGERVMHFAEIEAGEGTDPEHPTLYLRPAARLAEGHAFAVAVRGLSDVDGAPLAPSDAFRALRDGVETDAPALEARRAGFEAEVLAPLVKAGVARGALVQAWGFRTASGASAWGDLLAMRDDALGGSDAWGCAVTGTIEKEGDPDLVRVVHGTFTVPLYLASEERGARLVRGAGGRPARAGTAEAKFTAIVPRVALEKAQAGRGGTRLLVYGHGLFSSADDEVQRDFVVRFAQDRGAVVFATDLWGLAADDQVFTGGALPELNAFPAVIDRVAQGVVNQLVLMRAAGGCGALPAFQAGGATMVDASDRNYWGNSQGGNFGPTFAALSPDVERFALGVGGISYPIMMPRSIHWPVFETFLSLGYRSRLDRDLLMAMFAMQWDRVEGAAFAPHVLSDPLPGGSPKRVLAQIGLNDAQTPNVASHVAARTLGLPLLAPAAAPIDALPTFEGSAPSGLVVYDVGAPSLPPGTVPPSEDTPAHEGVRRDPRAQAQLDLFLRPGGRVEDTCGGPCAPLPAK